MTPQRRPSIRVALWVWYRGDRFLGFQSQPSGPTVQQTLRDAFSTAGLEATPIPSGRTDRGVHARMQVVGLRIPASFAHQTVIEAVRGRPELGICCLRPAPRHFHPQWSCEGKEYRYRLFFGSALATAWQGACWRPDDHPRLAGRTLSISVLAKLIAMAAGSRDFIAFHESSSPQKIRTIERAELQELGAGFFEVRFVGNAFARYQVRFLVGSAVAAAAGILSEDQFVEALKSGIAIPGLRAPGDGLILWNVRYPSALDPFSAADRAAEPELPRVPPFRV